MKRLRTAALIVFLPVLAGILLAEFYLRLTDGAGLSEIRTPSELRAESLQYRPTVYARHLLPAKPQRVKGLDGQPMTVNGKGYRGPDFSVSKPHGTVRILIYGGSAVFNPAVRDRETWPRLLEANLRSAGFANVEVINAGIPGHASADSLNRLLSEGRLLEPDYVLFYHGWNDIKHLRSPQPLVRRMMPLYPNPFFYYRGSVDAFMSENSQLYARLRQFYWAWRTDIGDEGAKRDWNGLNTDWTSERIVENARMSHGMYDEALGQLQLSIETFVDLARNIGAVPVLIRQARLVHAGNTEAERKRIRYGYVGMDHDTLLEAFRRIDEILETVARKKRIRLISSDAGVPKNLENFYDHVHLRRAGTAAVAAVVAEPLAEMLRRAQHSE